jgi:hypothetical protein
MSTPATHALHAIEMRANAYPCAIVQELRIMIEEVLALRPSCNLEDRGYADALLMKLDRLIGDQLVPSVHGDLPTVDAALPNEAEASLVAAHAVEAALA